MPGLAFDALDRHVIAGRGEAPAWVEADRTVTYAQLLERTAALAGGFGQLGILSGTVIEISLPPSLIRIEVALAAIRAELPIRAGAELVISGDPAVLQLAHDTVELAQILALGRVDPARAPRNDATDYLGELDEQLRDELSALLRGDAVHHH